MTKLFFTFLSKLALLSTKILCKLGKHSFQKAICSSFNFKKYHYTLKLLIFVRWGNLTHWNRYKYLLDIHTISHTLPILSHNKLKTLEFNCPDLIKFIIITQLLSPSFSSSGIFFSLLMKATMSTFHMRFFFCFMHATTPFNLPSITFVPLTHTYLIT